MAWKKKQIEDMNLHISVHNNKFKAYYDAWQNESDDRALFCRLYESILEECENMKKVKSNYINVAFNRLVKEDEEMMNEIVSFFTGETTRSYDGEEGYYKGA